MNLKDLPEVLDLGEGRTLLFFTWHTDDVVGAIETHPSLVDTPLHKAGEECAGGLYFKLPETPPNINPHWTVESWEPLTLSPSLLCRICGNHGFIRAGKWMSA